MLAAEAYALLYEGKSGQVSALDLLARAADNLRNLVALDRRNEPLLATLENILYQAEDAARELAGYRDGVDFSPSRLEAVEERLEQIKKLKRKYGGSIPEIISYWKRHKANLPFLKTWTNR
jgi:DNA repair protein RecN (Recombination protein N)